jgi:glutathione S-transferase
LIVDKEEKIMAIRLFNSQASMFCEKVRVVFALKKVPYDVVDVRKDERKSLIEYTGQRKVPSMDYNGECVIDSTIISARLEKDHPSTSIYPEGAANKGLCLAIEDWSDEVLIHANHAIRRAETPEARQKAEAEWDTHFSTLDQMYSGKKFLFERMTLADISIFSQLHYLYTAVKYEIPAKYKNLHGFMENMRQTLKLKALSDSFDAPSL